MKSRNTVIWLLILIALGGFVYYYEVIAGKKREAAKDSAEKIYTLPADQVESVRIENNGIVIRCIKDNSGKWTITEPLQLAADGATVLDVIATVLDTKIQRVLEEKAKDLTGYGLKEKPLRVTLTIAKKDYSLLLGDLNPTQAFVYCKRDSDDQVFMLFTNIRQHLDKELYDLRDKRVLHAQKHQIKALDIKSAQENIVLTHQLENDQWRIIQPLEVLADNKEINNFIDLLNAVPVKRFVAEEAGDLVQYGLDQPQMVIDITLSDDKTHQVLLLGKKVDAEGGAEILAKIQDKHNIFTLPAEIETHLFKKANDFRNKNLATFSTDDLSGLELISPNQTIILARKKVTYSYEWEMLKPEKAKAKDTVIYDVLNILLQTQVKEFIDQPEAKTDYGFAQPVLKINVLFNGKAQSNLALTFGAKKTTNDLIYVRVNDKIVAIDVAVLKPVNKKPADFKL
ncbi:MAG: DUF4340 domain-containing protein [Candidatus Schekmanbacteria bacterium]|nr:DUF4340 domain-containing protein [Candidatus Schekmanbacteria bacterium]